MNGEEIPDVIRSYRVVAKTITIANVVSKMYNAPPLVITHNKTLVAQLYGSSVQFFR
jgi:excinuclease UvrABC helicase subunit UvrB